MHPEQPTRKMTHAELMALPVSFPLEIANRALSIGRTQGYFMAKTGTYPVRVLQVGRAYRVTRYDLLRFLGFTAAAAATDEPEPGETEAA
ncbi:integrase [Streptomyces wuyuanensis]|uniref:integrase n=1 Tax=Streptomyces wuyuanensis TaxID=1196353 RepID=UPI00372281D7